MGLLQRLGLLPKTTFPPPDEVLARPIFEALAANMDNVSVEQLWKDQPHLRTVTDFIARSVASVSLHMFKRQNDGGRERLRDGDLPTILHKANSSMITYDLLYSSVMDLCLYDEFIWYVSPEAGEILPISPLWVQRMKWKDPWTLEYVILHDDRFGSPIQLDGERVVRVHGYAPGTYKRGTSRVNALRDVLKEQLQAAAYRGALWEKGPRISGVITRPKDASWDGAARARFKASWNAQYSGRGSGAGGVPVLEDGMDFKSFHLKASDEEYVDVAKLSLATVASVYQINPTMVGLLDNANYSNVREFRKSL